MKLHAFGVSYLCSGDTAEAGWNVGRAGRPYKRWPSCWPKKVNSRPSEENKDLPGK